MLSFLQGSDPSPGRKPDKHGSGRATPRIEEVVKHMTKTVTLTEPELVGQWDVEPLDDGQLLLSPHLGPTIEEIEADHGERLGASSLSAAGATFPVTGRASRGPRKGLG